MKQHSVRFRLALVALLSVTLPGFFSVSALAVGGAIADGKAVQRALPVGFPVPENSWLRGKEGPVVKIGVKNTTIAELVAFFEKGLKKAGYRVMISEDAAKRSRLGTSVDEGWTMVITPPNTTDMQAIHIERRGDELFFVATARK